MPVRSGQKANHQTITHKHDNSTAHCAQPLGPVAQHNFKSLHDRSLLSNVVNVIRLGSCSHSTPRTFAFHQLRVRFLNWTHWMCGPSQLFRLLAMVTWAFTSSGAL